MARYKVKGIISLINANYSAFSAVILWCCIVISKIMFLEVTHLKPIKMPFELQELHLLASSMHVKQFVEQTRHYP